MSICKIRLSQFRVWIIGNTEELQVPQAVNFVNNNNNNNNNNKNNNMEEGSTAFKILTGKPTAKYFWGSVSVDGRTILERTL